MPFVQIFKHQELIDSKRFKGNFHIDIVEEQRQPIWRTESESIAESGRYSQSELKLLNTYGSLLLHTTFSILFDQTGY